MNLFDKLTKNSNLKKNWGRRGEGKGSGGGWSWRVSELF